MKALDPAWESRAVPAEEVVAAIAGGDRVFVQGAAATPIPLLEALCRREDLHGVHLYHLHLAGPLPFAEGERWRRFHSIAFFADAGARKLIGEGKADFMPVFLKDIPALFEQGVVPLDAALVQLSPPDRHGMCTLGTSVDAARAAAESGGRVLAEINRRMPRTHGNSAIALQDVDAFCLTDRPLPSHEPPVIDEATDRIGALIADLIEDRATLQMGIGAIPDAVLARLGGKHDLGVHTEMFSDGLIDLIEGGVVTNRFKKVHPGRTVTSFVTGSRRLYDFVDDNPAVEFHPCDHTNDTHLIRQNPRVVAINSALEVDLTGQVCADSIGHRIYSGIGGQMDFIHGAALSEGGKPVIALPSTARGGTVSRITAELKAGAGVVTTRGHVHWVVTEHGAVNLHGRTLRQRAEALVSIAHPDFRRELEQRAAGRVQLALSG